MSREKPYKQRGKSWYLDYKLDGDERQRGLLSGASSEAEARRDALDHLERRKLHIRGLITIEEVKATITVEQLFDRFYNEVTKKKVGHVTLRGFGDRWAETHGKLKISELSRVHIEEHVTKRRNGYTFDGVAIGAVSDPVIYNGIAYFKRALAKARRAWGLAVAEIDYSELDVVATIKRNVKPWSAAKFAEVKEAVAATEPDFLPLIQFELLHPRRRSNVVGLLKTEIDFGLGAHGTVRQRVKGGAERSFLLTAESRAIIDSVWDLHPTNVFTARAIYSKPELGRRAGERYPITASVFEDFWRRTREAIGEPELHFHDLRHVVGTFALKATGGDLKAVQDLLGHENLQTTQRYIDADLDRAANATNAVTAALSVQRPTTPDPAAASRVAELERLLVEARAVALADDTSNVVPLRRKAS